MAGPSAASRGAQASTRQLEKGAGMWACGQGGWMNGWFMCLPPGS